MDIQSLPTSENYYHNIVTAATPNPLITNPDAIDEEFATTANQVLHNAVEVTRSLVGVHQAAIAIVVQNDWSSVRKYFSLSAKYASWADYQTPAVGYGIHNWLLHENKPVRLTQTELEAHRQWKTFGREQRQHPPIRSWLATPLIDRDDVNWGLFQLSDKYEGDFT